MSENLKSSRNQEQEHLFSLFEIEGVFKFYLLDFPASEEVLLLEICIQELSMDIISIKLSVFQP